MGKNDNMRKIYKLISLVLVSIIIIVFGFAGTYKGSNVINEVRQYLKSYYVDDLPDSILNQTSVEDIVASINKTDPYTQYLTVKKYNSMVDLINNNFLGIGIYIQIIPEGVKVVSVVDGSPEKAAGIMPGDIIIMAENHLLANVTSDSAVTYIKGTENEIVKLKILRDSKILDIDILREKFSSSTIDEKILDNHIGYLRITSFGEDTGKLFSEKLKNCQDKKVDSYIIDLRYNVGGSLNSALDIAGYFIGSNVAFITNGKHDGVSKNYGIYHGQIINKPIIFLVNEYSASASEILAGAVRDYGKAYFIGTKTFGKGSVQWSFPLSNKNILKLTIDKFYSPKGTAIDKVGIEPDLYINDDIDSLSVAELIFNSNFSLKNNKGFVRMDLKKKSVIVSINKMEQPSYWQAYTQLLNAASKDGKIMFGTGGTWARVPQEKIGDMISMFYPDYKVISRFSDISVDSEFTIGFKSKMIMKSINNKNIELIDTKTGIRVPVKLKSIMDTQVVVSPMEDLIKDRTYYLVVDPNILKADNKPLGEGKIYEIQTV
jgi:carboxyl-terminal processing protease